MTSIFYKRKGFYYFLNRLKSQLYLLKIFIHDPRFNKSTSNRSAFLVHAPSLLRKLVYDKYYKKLDEILAGSQKISLTTSPLKSLYQTGLCCIGSVSPAFLKSINDAYPLNQNLPKIGELSYESEILVNLHNELPTLSLVAKSYYQGSCFYRNNPTIHASNAEIESKYPTPSTVFHCDGYHQLSVMILLNDIDKDSFHMEYILESHAGYVEILDRSMILQSKVNNSPKKVKLTGKAGTVYMFDTDGLHRGLIAEKTRLMLHINLHAGNYPCRRKFE